MTLVSSLQSTHLCRKMEEAMPRAHSALSSSSGLYFSLRDIDEELDEIEESKVYVAVGKEVQEWMENLKWLLKSTDKNLTIVFLHVHQPAKKIATPIGYMPASGLEQQELSAYRKLEKEKMNKCLKTYVDICAKYNFNATTLSTDNDDIAKGLLELIKQHKVTDLVMGAGSAKNFSILTNSKAKEKAPKSRIAITVREKAEPSCRIRFISRCELICIREPCENAPDASDLSPSSSSSSSGHSIPDRSQSMPPSQAEQTIGFSGLDRKSKSVNVLVSASLPTGSLHPSYYSGFEDPYAQSSSCSSHQNVFSEVDNYSLISDSLPATPLNYSPSSLHNITEDICSRLKEAIVEAEKLKREAYEEASRRGKVELDLVQANRQIKIMENMLNAEMQTKLEIEDKFVRQSIELEKHKKMYEQAQIELKKANELLSSLDMQNVRLSQRVTELHGSSSQLLVNCTEFTYSEIKEATKNFDPSHKIGEGGFGAVYRGFLRYTTVAIKILTRDSIQGDPQFYQEIEILSRIRHPHLVTLIGACLEARALVYEYLALGSLDNHIRLLPWQVRVRIAREICSALIFLHSSRVVHGDLKPENVLLDSNFMVKLSDFGICRQVHMTNTTTTPYHITDQPKGTLVYMDPEYLASGELTPQYDVYSFGIVLLQLVTGKEAKRLKNDVEDAIEKRQIEKMVDPLAGWPPEQASNMIQIGLLCSDVSRRKRPDLGKDVWVWLESIANVAPASMRRSLTKPSS